MIDEKIVLLSRLRDYSGHRLAKYISGNLKLGANLDTYFQKPLQELFSEVIVCDYVERITEAGIRGANDEIIELVRKEQPKYVLWFMSIYELLESTLDSIRESGSILVAWSSDDEYRFNSYSRWWTPHIDYSVTHDKEAVPKYQALGAKAIFAFPCEGVAVDRDWSKIEENYDVSFVGLKSKSLRGQYIDAIKEKNIPIQLFGRGWESGYIPHDEMINVFKTSKINLNFSGTGNRTGFKGRLSTVCLAGGFLLTEYIPGIEDYFKIDEEIACFKNTKEMIEKIIYYLGHDEERRAIARAGWQRAINEYTPFHMYERIFNEVERDITEGIGKNHPQKFRIPVRMRISRSRYFFRWARAYLEEGYEDFWRDALALSLSDNPFNITAWYYYIAGLSPSFIRTFLFKLYLPWKYLEEWIIKMLSRFIGRQGG